MAEDLTSEKLVLISGDEEEQTGWSDGVGGAEILADLVIWILVCEFWQDNCEMICVVLAWVHTHCSLNIRI